MPKAAVNRPGCLTKASPTRRGCRAPEWIRAQIAAPPRTNFRTCCKAFGMRKRPRGGCVGARAEAALGIALAGDGPDFGSGEQIFGFLGIGAEGATVDGREAMLADRLA